MSLCVVVKGSEGLVLATDSRLTLTAQIPNRDGSVVTLPVNFDNSNKLLTFGKHHFYVGAVTYGDATIGNQLPNLRTASSLIPEFEVNLGNARMGVGEFSKELSTFFAKKWKELNDPRRETSGMSFIVAGYDEHSAYGVVYEFNVPNRLDPVQRSENDFGISMGGQTEITGRMLQGFDEGTVNIVKQTLGLTSEQEKELRKALPAIRLQIPIAVLPLQDCIDLAVFLINTTSTAQVLSIGVRGVGGAIDVAVITQRDGLNIIKQKQLFARDY